MQANNEWNNATLGYLVNHCRKIGQKLSSKSPTLMEMEKSQKTNLSILCTKMTNGQKQSFKN